MFLFETETATTLSRVLSQPRTGEEWEVWSFDDRRARAEIELQLRDHGITARIRSAYKPLLCVFREELRPGWHEAEVIYPRPKTGDPLRFLREAYPLAELWPNLRFIEGADHSDYIMRLSYEDRIEEHSVFAPNRLIAGRLCPCGWLRSGQKSAPFATAYEDLLASLRTGIAEAEGRALSITALYPAVDEPLGYGEECLSLANALSEDIAALLREALPQSRARVQVIHAQTPALRITHETAPSAQLQEAHLPDLDRAQSAPSQAQITAELARLDGLPLTAFSPSGHALQGRYIQSDEPPLMIAAGFNGTSTSGVVAALRAGPRLAFKGAHFTLCPLENPEDYVLQDSQIHSAATAQPFANYALRQEAEAQSRAALLLLLDGYGCREQPRPLTAPDAQSAPQGLLLDLSYQEGWAPMAYKLLEEITAALAEKTEGADLSTAQRSAFLRHGGQTDYETLNGIPYRLRRDAQAAIPLTLHSRYPDAGLTGAGFVAAHEAQLRIVLCAHDTWRKLQMQP